MTAPAIADNSGGNLGVLVPQPHGGALQRGRSNKGAGRRPDRIKRLMQQGLERVAKKGYLEAFAEGTPIEAYVDGALTTISPTVSERIKAHDTMHKIGTGDVVPVSDVRARLKNQLRIIRTELDGETADRICGLLHEVWR